MPISYVYTGQPMTGTANDDFMIGYKGSTGTDDNTINGNDGDDLVIADSSDTWIPSSSYLNDSIANAFNLETLTSTWTTAENQMFGDWTIPHSTVMCETTIGQSEFFRIAIGAGQQITIDLDFASNVLLGNPRDLVVELQDSLGNIIATADDSLLTDGGQGSFPSTPGSSSSYDPYLTFTVPSAGIYYINVRPFGGGPSSTFTDNNTFVMNVSVTGHAVNATNPIQGADTVNGGNGDDYLFGQGGADIINGGIGNDFIDGGSGGDILHGEDGNDIVYGGDGTEENAHGDGGDDLLYSGGEGHYYGDDGNDIIYAGLTSGINEILDGGTGVDTLDTTTWNGTYVVNLVTGATNFGESFINFENVITGNGTDTITGTAGANSITGHGGADTINAGAGFDTSIYTIASTSATWARSVSGAWTVTAGADGVDTLTGVELLHFTDRDVHLDRAYQTFSGDGTSDILFRNTAGSVVSWDVTGTTLNSATYIASVAPATWTPLGTGDFDGDGRDDIVWRNSNGIVYTWQMNGPAIGVAGAVAGLGPEWSFLGVGDFNGDARDDMIWRNTNNGTVYTWDMNTTTSIGSVGPVASLGAEWSLQGVGDFNSDGRDDFLWRNASGATYIWTMNDRALSAAATSAQAGNNWHVEGVGDFNGDGRDDILWRNDNGLIATWSMNGSTVSQTGNIASVGAEWHIMQVGDYNGDGRDDILWQNDNGVVYAWMLNGNVLLNSGAIAGVGPEWGII